MRPAFTERTIIQVIRFTRRIAVQCNCREPFFPDWVVCDTIANGSRHPLGRSGKHGGVIVRFEKTFSRPAKEAAAARSPITVQVLGEMTPDGCVALQILAASKTRKKMWDQPGFFNRSTLK
jgi:hypothetical protein